MDHASLHRAKDVLSWVAFDDKMPSYTTKYINLASDLISTYIDNLENPLPGPKKMHIWDTAEGFYRKCINCGMIISMASIANGVDGLCHGTSTSNPATVIDDVTVKRERLQRLERIEAAAYNWFNARNRYVQERKADPYSSETRLRASIPVGKALDALAELLR